MAIQFCPFCFSDVVLPHEHPNLKVNKRRLDLLWPPRSPKQEELVSEVYYLPIGHKLPRCVHRYGHTTTTGLN